ncbi:MAG: hypothetical protein AAF682_13030 [Planctomycetota bacterium]
MILRPLLLSLFLLCLGGAARPAYAHDHDPERRAGAVDLTRAWTDHLAGRTAPLSTRERSVRRSRLFLALHEVGVARDAKAAPLVRTVADLSTRPEDWHLLWKALDTLWKCGAAPELFAGWSEGAAGQPMRAAVAMYVLAREPGERAARLGQIARAATADGRPYADAMLRAASLARCVAAREAEYRRVVSIEAKVDYLARQAIGTYLPGHGGSAAPSELHDPIAEWARGRLHALSHEYPARTLAAVQRADVGAREPEHQRELRAWLALYL